MKFNYNYIILLFYIYTPLFGYITYNLFGFGAAIFSIPLVLSVYLFTPNKKTLYFPDFLKLYLLFIVFVFASKYVINNQSLSFDNNFRNYLLYVSTFLSMIYFFNLKINEEIFNRTIILVKLLIVISLLVSIIQYFNPLFFLNENLFEERAYVLETYDQRRILSIYSWAENRNSMAFSFPILMNVILGWEYIKHKKIKSYWLIVIVGIICILSQSRNFLLLYLIVVLYYLYKSLSFKNILNLTILIGLGVIVLVYIQYDFDFYIEQRITNPTYLTRIEAFAAFAHTFQLNPTWGTGGLVSNELLSFYGRETRLHNGYLAVLYYYGLLGGVLFFLFTITMYRKISKVYKSFNINIVFITFLCIAAGNLAVDYYKLYDVGLFMTLLVSKQILNNKDNFRIS